VCVLFFLIPFPTSSRWHLLVLQSILKEGLLFNVVSRLATGSNSTVRVSTSISKRDVLVLVGFLEDSGQSLGSVAPTTHVEGLFLNPDNLLEVRVAVKNISDLSKGEGMQLLNSEEGSVLDIVGLSGLGQGSKHLANRDNQTLSLLLGTNGNTMGLVLNDPLEVRVISKVRERRSGQGVSQQGLGEQQNQRLAELTVHLSSQQMEDVSGSGGVGNLHVGILVLTLQLIGTGEVSGVFVTELQESLESGRRVIRTLTVETVGERQNKTRALSPLDLTSGNKQIDNNLGSVGEITKLSLPDDKGIRVGQRVTVLETHDTVLRQRRVGNGDLGLVGEGMLQGSVLLLTLLVNQDSVTLREGTSLNILTRETDVVALLQQGAKSKSLTSRPVNVLALSNSLQTVVENSLEVSVNVKALRRSRDNSTNVFQGLRLNGSRKVGKDLGSKLLGSLETIPSGSEPLLTRRNVVLRVLERRLKVIPNPLLVLVDIILSEASLFNKLLGVNLKNIALVGNLLVHQGLGERRLVSLVVTVLSVADNINDDVTLEGRSPFSSKVEDEVHGLHIVRVNMEDGGINRLGDIGGVGGRSRESGVGGETNLVVDNNVNGTTSAISREVQEAKGLKDNTLTSKGSVTMEKDTHGLVTLSFVILVKLNSTGLTEDNRVLSFKMGGVGNKRKVNLLTRRSRSLVVGTKMVLNITTAEIEGSGTAELRENTLVGLSDNVGKHVESTSVGHTNDNILNTSLNGSINESLHGRNSSLGTLKTKTLVVRELSGKEGLKRDSPNKTVQDAALLVNSVFVGLRNLNSLSNPVTLLARRNVHVFNTVATTVGLLADLDDLSQSSLVATVGKSGEDTGAESELTVKVSLSEAVVSKSELLRGLDLGVTKGDLQRISLGSSVTTDLVGTDEKLDLQVIHNTVAGTTGSSRQSTGDSSNTAGVDGGRSLVSGGSRSVRFHIFEVRLP